MTGLIKAGSAAPTVRPFAAPRKGPLEMVAGPSEPSAEALALAGLRDALARAEAALAALRQQASERAVEARAEGLAEGLAAAQADEEKKLRLVAAALDKAGSAWTHRLDTLEPLTIALVRAALAKLFGDWEESGDRVAAAAGAKLKTLRREAVLAIRVSARDFDGDAGVAALARQLAQPGNRIFVDPELSAGECRLDLKLGHLDIGPRTQWTELDRLLERIAAGEAVEP